MGCFNLERFLERARREELKKRRKHILKLESRVRSIRDEPNSDPDRVLIGEFLKERFENETDNLIRSQVLALAVQGEYGFAEQLLTQAARDSSHRLVRLTGIQYLREYQIEKHRDLLLDVLAREQDPIVKLEILRTIGFANPANAEEAREWALPLLTIFLDRTEGQHLRDQAYWALVRITGYDWAREDVRKWAEYGNQS